MSHKRGDKLVTAPRDRSHNLLHGCAARFESTDTNVMAGNQAALVHLTTMKEAFGRWRTWATDEMRRHAEQAVRIANHCHTVRSGSLFRWMPDAFSGWLIESNAPEVFRFRLVHRVFDFWLGQTLTVCLQPPSRTTRSLRRDIKELFRRTVIEWFQENLVPRDYNHNALQCLACISHCRI